MRKTLDFLHSHFYLEVMALFFLLLSFIIEPLKSIYEGNGFIFNPIKQIFHGYLKIVTSPSILITDYVYVGGLGATFFNVATILIINLFLVKQLKLKINGPIYAGLVMICGFSFFGKNIFNTIPVYFGIYLFSLFKKIPYKSFIIAILFSTGISPLVSYTIFGLGLPYYISIPIGLFCGILAGFILPAFTSHTIIFSEGYNLYNTGFALGIISAIFYGAFTYCGFKVESVSLYDYSTTGIFYIVLAIISITAIVAAFVMDNRVYVKYFELLKTTGRLISDYAFEFKNDAVLLNFGIIGLFLLAICMLFKVPMNGVVFGSVLSILGFAGFGMHIKNLLPIWIGAGIAIFVGMVINNDYNLTIASIITFIFASGLAPIAGRYGLVYGMIAGILHVIICPIMIKFQGGFDLYNNGISCGFVAAIVSVTAEKIGRGVEKHGRKSKNL